MPLAFTEGAECVAMKNYIRILVCHHWCRGTKGWGEAENPTNVGNSSVNTYGGEINYREWKMSWVTITQWILLY